MSGSAGVPPGAQVSFQARVVVGTVRFPAAGELMVLCSEANRKDLLLPHEPHLKVRLIISGPPGMISLLIGLNHIRQNAFI